MSECDKTTGGKHPNDMTWEELRALVSEMGNTALDLAQHLHFTNELLRHEHRAKAYERACQMAYDLAWLPFNWEPTQPKRVIGIFLGENGLERCDMDLPTNIIRKVKEDAK